MRNIIFEFNFWYWSKRHLDVCFLMTTSPMNPGDGSQAALLITHDHIAFRFRIVEDEAVHATLNE